MIWSLVWAARKRLGYKPGREKKLKGLLRLGAYAVVVMVLVTLASAHQAKADVSKASLSFGRELAPLVSQWDGDSHHIKLNGQDLFMNISFANEQTGAILDKYEEQCRNDPGAFGRAVKDVPPLGKVEDKKLSSFLKMGVFRREEHGEGTLLCFVDGKSTPKSFMDAMKLWTQSGDLGALGKARYVFVQKTKDGMRRVITMCTDDAFKMTELVPASGREPTGSDPAGIPRPENAARVLSATLEGTPFGVFVYKTGDSPEKVTGFYDKVLFEQGWVVFSPEVEGGSAKGFFKDGVVVTLGAIHDESGQTMVSVGTSSVSPEEAKVRSLHAITH